VLSRALELHGTNSYVELPADAFTNLNEATIEAWIRRQGVTANTVHQPFQLMLAGPQLRSFLPANSSGLNAVSLESDLAARRAFAAGIFPVGRWGHLDFQPTAEPQQRLDWVLADSEKALVALGLGGTVERVPPGFPAGTVVATALTDELGNFKFPNVSALPTS
jgi:hypothetical protein